MLAQPRGRRGAVGKVADQIEEDRVVDAAERLSQTRRDTGDAGDEGPMPGEARGGPPIELSGFFDEQQREVSAAPRREGPFRARALVAPREPD